MAREPKLLRIALPVPVLLNVTFPLKRFPAELYAIYKVAVPVFVNTVVPLNMSGDALARVKFAELLLAIVAVELKVLPPLLVIKVAPFLVSVAVLLNTLPFKVKLSDVAFTVAPKEVPANVVVAPVEVTVPLFIVPEV